MTKNELFLAVPMKVWRCWRGVWIGGSSSLLDYLDMARQANVGLGLKLVEWE
jgi:hypothetical protein